MFVENVLILLNFKEFKISIEYSDQVGYKKIIRNYIPKGLNMPNQAKDKEPKAPKSNKLIPPEKLDNLYEYAKTNPRDLITYVLLILGLILLFLLPTYGGLILGVVGGVYFSKELAYVVRNYEEIIEDQGFVRCLVLAGVLLGFLIAAPSIFIGAAIVVLLRLFVFSDKEEKKS